MKNPKVFLDLYLSMRTSDVYSIDKQMLRLSKSTSAVRKWRVMCQMWMGDIELQDGFGYAIELYRGEKFNSVAQLSQRLQAANVVCKPTANMFARAMFGFDGRFADIKPLSEIYAYYLEHPRSSPAMLSEWGGHNSVATTSVLITLHKASKPLAKQVWSLWDKGIATGDDANMMLDRMCQAGIAQATARRVIDVCMVIRGVKLKTNSTREHAVCAVKLNPGLTVTEYIKRAVDAGYKASAYQHHMLALVRFGENIVNDVITKRGEVAKLAQNVTADTHDEWIDKMVIKGCHAVTAYQWNAQRAKTA